ncbi:hypothetical protein CEP54_002559 [Fusarium duplospermum]|uniref:Uncharacterized protein n=1 Tax=Fusarium duplospermum TaxID=1325734 RepID=A0A428QUN9_9HYPO|nr:hypothetical protein CEP54_002559 [Fusarium duplospermum]
MDHIDGKLPPLENGVVLGSLGDEAEAHDDEGEEFVDGGDDIDVDGGVMIEDEGEGINDGDVPGDFEIAMVERVVADPQEVPSASSTTQEGRSSWFSWFTGR